MAYRRWPHTEEERRVIRRYGGTPLREYGTDGILLSHPVEVRSIRKDDRYRIQQDVHRNLVRNDGSYIFVNDGRSKVMLAEDASKLMGRGPWYKDWKYPHKFLKEGDVW